ncbi:MAG: DUF2207 domain-containing protein [Bacteroidia bacterium]|nr:DUF2207 domain-containing protein [Bacteroidia bacterium]
MKKIITTLFFALFTLSALAIDPQIRDIDIKCSLDQQGSAHITEVWDVTVASGTEWYLVRENLGDIEIKDLAVSENGTPFINEGIWDVDRSIEEKAGRCGLHETGDGCEICWGVGNLGDHVFTVSYTMTNAVKSLDDYDMLHMQFISDQLSSNPEHARVEVSVPGVQIDTTNSRLWGFGYYGDVRVEDNSLVCESTQEFDYYSSVIVLARFDKGMIADPQSVQDRDFQTVLDGALEEASYDDDYDDDDAIGVFAVILGIIVMVINGGWLLLLPFVVLIVKVVTKKRMLGTTNKNTIPWSREVPFNGDYVTTSHVLSAVGESNKRNRIASAMILKMIYLNAIKVRTDAEGKVELALADNKAIEGLDQYTKQLWDMIREASGRDKVLQEKEFSSWAKSHQSKVSNWAQSVRKAGKDSFEKSPWHEGSKVSAAGREECRKAIGFKKFLVDFTMLKERASREVVLWQDYMVYAALFGVADKVADELKEINPMAFKDVQNISTDTFRNVVFMSNDLGRAITSAHVQYSGSSGSHGSRGGYGGHSSYHGGGGFSGGGHGGGSR